MKKILHYLSILLLLLCSSTMLGQLYPVQVIPQIIPPYSSKLVEYTDSSVNRMQLQMVTTDLTVINRPVYLKMYIEGNGIKAQSRDLIQGVQPLFINGGDILSLSGMELSPYFQLRNLDGINQNTYANTLPDGMYSICYEVYDLVTRKRLSQKSCAHMYLMLNDPPILNLPMDKEQMVQGDFTNIVFSWTPRQINALNVSYSFEIKELRDPNISGSYAFDFGLPVHKVTDIRSTTLLYDQLMPTLVAGKRYAWRVKATSFNGLAANSVFKNDGYSEVRSFTLTKDCGAPSGILPLPNGSNAIKLNWQGAPTHLKYHVQYRKEGVAGAEWFERYVVNNHTIITDLKPGFTYEFRVGGACEPEVYPAKPNYTYSEIVRYEIKQSKDKDKDFSCGLKADTQITNREPMTNLVVNESFYAGDFTVKILGLEGMGNSPYSGVGSIYVPYLGITLAVEFKNIQINTDYQLINGVVETAYDKNWENVKNTNELNKKESLHEEVKFEIKEITIDSEGNPKLVGTKGEEKILEKNKDYTVVDGAGKEWTIPSEFDGKTPITQPTGVKAKTGVPQPENTKGVGKDGQVTEFSAKGVRIYFENGSKAAYTFDNASGANASNKYGALYKKVKGEYLPYKAVENGKTDKVIARVKFTGEAVKLDSLSLDFKTSAGSAIAFVKNSDTEYELTVKGRFNYAEDQIMAVYKPKGEEKYVVAGAMQLIHLTAITLPLKIVPTSKSVDTKALESALIAQYRRVGVTVNSKVLELYTEGYLDVSEVSKDDKKTLSSYTPSEQKFIEQYFSSHDQEAAFYLFVTDQPGGLKGRMPIQSQFGFVSDRDGMTSMALTAAHELGHGAFELQHPFTQYSTKGGAANSIMDLPAADDFNQVDWKQMNMRKFSLKTVIQNKGDGAYDQEVHFALAPNGKIVDEFYLNGKNITKEISTLISNNYVISDISYNGVTFVWDNVKNSYVNDGKLITIKRVKQNKYDNLVNLLKTKGDGCNYLYTIVEWTEEDEINTSMSVQELIANKIRNKTDKDWKLSSYNIKSADCLMYNITIEELFDNDKNCNKNELLVQQENKLRQIFTQTTFTSKELVTAIVKDKLCIEALRSIDWKDMERAFIQLSTDTTINENKEKAILRLIAALKTTNYKDFLSLVQKDENKILRNLLYNLDDSSINPFDGNHFTSLIKALTYINYHVVGKYIDTSKYEINDKNSFIVKPNSYILPEDNESHIIVRFDSKVANKLNVSQGVWSITKKCEWVASFGGEGSEDCKIIESKLIYNAPVYLDPFDYVVLLEGSDFSLIEGLNSTSDKKAILVPSIVLYYAYTKGDAKNLKLYIQNSADLLTIAIPVTKLVSAPGWLARGFVFVDKWTKINAGANLIVNNSELSNDPEVREVVDAYNKVTLALNVATISVAVGKAPIEKFLRTFENPNSKQKLITAANKGSKEAKMILDAGNEFETISEKAYGKGWLKTSFDNIPNNFYKTVDEFTSTFDKTGEVSQVLRNKAFELYNSKSWKELEVLFKENKLNGGWPPANGGYNIKEVELTEGMKFDRYGGALNTWNGDGFPLLGGNFTSPIADGKRYSFGQRALNLKENAYDFYYEIEILKDLRFKGQEADVIPWFGQAGGGKQTMWDIDINKVTGKRYTLTELADQGYIKITIKEAPSKKYSNFVGRSYGGSNPVVSLDDLFISARQSAIGKFGKEAEDLIYIKFSKESGAAAEIINHYGIEGLNALKKVNNIDDVAKELVRNKKVYRAVNESSYNFEKLKTEGLIDGSPAQYPTYVSLDKYDDANLIKSKLQLPKKPTWVAEFDGNQILNDVKIPNGKYLKSDYKEVLCRSYPNLGEGGGSQFITNSPIKISRLVNLETGEVINFK